MFIQVTPYLAARTNGITEREYTTLGSPRILNANLIRVVDSHPAGCYISLIDSVQNTYDKHFVVSERYEEMMRLLQVISYM